MEGDFSRFTFDPKKHYDRVLLQQGRVQVDADWNEQVDILSHRHEIEISDIVGQFGVPQECPGFGIRVRKGLLFDGLDGHVQIQSSDIFSFCDGSPFTIEAWINPSSSGTGGPILTKLYSEDSQAEYSLFLQSNGTILFQYTELTQTIEKKPRDYHLSTRKLVTHSTIYFDRVNHIVVTFNGTFLIIYLNGAIAAKGLGIQHYYNTANTPLLIGASPCNQTNIFCGVIYEICLWNIAQNPAEVKAQLYASAHAECPEQVGLWKFNSKEIDFIPDQSDNNNHGYWVAKNTENRPSWCKSSLSISPGRCYIHGLICENNTEIFFDNQTNAPGVVLPNIIEPFLIYLDVWQRSITAIQDPTIREIALGETDTATRSKIVWQVKAVPIREAQQIAEGTQLKGRLRMRKQAYGKIDGNFLYRIEIHNNGVLFGLRDPYLSVGLNSESLKFQENQIQFDEWDWHPQIWRIGQCVEIFDSANINRQGILALIIDVDLNLRQLTLDMLSSEASNYQTPHLQKIATCKWSRENGSIVFPIENIDDFTITLGPCIYDISVLKPGSWVEIENDTSILQNQVFPLFKIIEIHTNFNNSIQIVLNHRPPRIFDVNPSLHPLLKRWDQQGDALERWRGAIPIVADDWLPLEGGIEAAFEGQLIFHSRDYWFTPARIKSQAITWPHDHNQIQSLAPEGVQHYFAPLAEFNNDFNNPIITDLRKFFYSATAENIRGNIDLKSEDSTLLSVDIEPEALDPFFKSETNSSSIQETNNPLLDYESAPINSTIEQIHEQGFPTSKLASKINDVPDKYSIIGYTNIAPTGYKNTGIQLHARVINPYWEILPTELPEQGAVKSAALNDKIYCIWESGTMWSYDPYTNDISSPWQREEDLPRPLRYAYGVAVLDDCIFVVGGYESNNQKSDRVESYDPKLHKWNTVASLLTARSHLGVAAINGKLYAIGGYQYSRWSKYRHRQSKINEMYDPVYDRWFPQRPLPSRRSRLGLSVYGGKIYAIGGVSNCLSNILGQIPTKRVDIYSPSTNRWSKASSLPTPKYDIFISIIDEKIYVSGKHKKQKFVNSLDIYNPNTNSWSMEVSLPSLRSHYGFTSLYNKLYIVGGLTLHNKNYNLISSYCTNTPCFIFEKIGGDDLDALQL